MLLKEAIKEINGLGHVVEQLELHSGTARRLLLDEPYLETAAAIRDELARVSALLPLDAWPAASLLAGRLKETRGTIRRLAAGETVDDIELFEIKNLALLAGEVTAETRAAGVTVVDIPRLEPVIDILDPEGSRLACFHLHDSYSPELARLRALLRAGEATRELLAAAGEEEERVREHLSTLLHPYHRELAAAHVAIARLDILLAKARRAREAGWCLPVIAAGTTRLEGLTYPPAREAARARGREYQPVDIAIGQEPCLVTGINMGGKTLLLKGIALAQALFQFGFPVPAARAAILPVDEIHYSPGDGEDERDGLSSFAAGMLQLNRITRATRSGRHPLVLMDEPARGTNPAEGSAIVDAIVAFLGEHGARAIVTTHYGGIHAPCRRLRVKGIADAAEPLARVDYSLVEDASEHVPREAARVAAMLGVDPWILEKIKHYTP